MLILDSVKAVLDKAIESGKLVPARPIAHWAGEPRAVLMCEPIATALANGRNDEDEKERQCWAKVEAAFSHFIEGSHVTESLVKQLKEFKFEHWEFRCRKPKPSLRIFGRFIAPDVYVATHPIPRRLLGGMNSPEFEHEKLVCEEHWVGAMLGEVASFPPDFRYENYITENAMRKLRI